MQELLIYRCTSNYYMTWVMSICGFKGILLIFGVFLAWETRNVHYPSLNDSKNIGLAVYNVFMFSCLALVVEFVVTYPPLKMLVGRSIVLVGTTSTISLLFVPKVRNCRSSCKDIFQSNNTIVNPSFTLLDIKMAIQENYHVDQKITYTSPCIYVSEL